MEVTYVIAITMLRASKVKSPSMMDGLFQSSAPVTVH